MKWTRNQKTVLSIDGGGIRGIIPAMILTEIEERTLVKIMQLINGRSDENDDQDAQKAALHPKVSSMIKTNKTGKEFIPTAQLFDLIAGASTGGILALALTLPDPKANDQPKYTAEELIGLYKKDGRKIFCHSRWRRLPTIERGVSSIAKNFIPYSSKGIKCVLNRRFGQTRLKEALRPVLIPSYEMVRRLPWFFKSTRAACEGSTHDFSMTDVALATSAAPTYFNSHKISVTDDNGQEYEGEFIDGGIYANHPAMCAFVEVKCEDILLVSLGTGERMPLPKNWKDWRVFFWARRILNVIFDGASDTVNHQLEELIANHCERFFRFQPRLCRENVELDNVKALPELEKITRQFIRTKDGVLKKLCCLLAKRFLERLEIENS